jgi:MFS family permease
VNETSNDRWSDDSGAAEGPSEKSPAGVFSPGNRLLTSGLVMIVTLVAFEALAVATIMPLVENDLDDLWLYGWVFSAFFLGNLVGVVVAGSAADRMRPAIPFAIGLVVFSVGLVVGGAAGSMLVLVLGRVLQGLGAGAMPAVSYVCIGRSYRPDQRPKMFALISSAWVIPSIFGPTLAGVIGEAVGWRWVFYGLLPLCGVIGLVALAGIRKVPAAHAPSGESNLGKAILVAVGAGLLLAGFGQRSWYLAVPLVLIGSAIGVSAYKALTPPGTLRARPGLPATIAVRGLLNFAFFAADAYVPFVLTTMRGLSPAISGLALTSASFTWTAASWIQARMIDRVGARRLVGIGMVAIAVACLGMILILSPAVPALLGIVVWGVGGFGIGLAYAPLSIVTLAHAPRGQEGKVSASLQLSDMLGVALGTGIAGVLVAGGASLTGSNTAGLIATFALGGAVGLATVYLSRRVPGRRELAS